MVNLVLFWLRKMVLRVLLAAVIIAGATVVANAVPRAED